MRMVPNAPPASTRSNAEKKVFGLLEASQVKDATCFHSLRLHHHRDKVSGEADFVVVMPRGVLVLEVKGGRVSQRAGGWVYIDRDDVEHYSSEGPFRQAETAMYALRDRLRELLGGPALRSLPFGFAVVTPDCSLPTRTVEWGPEVLLDQSRLRGLTDLTDVLPEVMNHWRDERDIPEHVLAAGPEMEAVIAACRPDFDAVPSLAGRVSEIVQEMQTATEEQYRILDMVGVLDRVVIAGGAGTGKTMIAAEAARRAADRGADVLLTCHAPTLASWLGTLVPDTVSVVSHGSLKTEAGDYNFLVCDEAQDLMTEEGLDLLDTVVAGGIDEGRWMMFLDPQYQAGVDGEFSDEVYGLLLDRASASRALPLSENLRNTSYIVTETTLLTGARPGAARVSGGGPVHSEYVQDAAEEVQVLRSWLREMRREEMPAGSVTVLTPDTPARLLDRLPAKDQRQLRRLAASGAASWPISETSICSVADFKGLENDVVILADLWDLDPREGRNVLYVALTRARVELRVAWPEGLRSHLDELRMSNINLLETT